MNKFNKKLTISLPQDPLYSQENQSPSVPESGLNDKQAILQFRQFRDGGDSEFGDMRTQIQNSKLNFVQFQEFHITRYDTKEKVKTQQQKKSPKNKKNVFIEVPDRDEEQTQDRKFKLNKNNDNYSLLYDEDKFKQPPAPSKGSKMNKVFIFPTTPIKKQQKQKDKEKQKIQSQSKQELKKNFERERQQFYKQKSRLQKQLLIKNGQIQMLHKLLTQNFSSGPQRHEKVIQNVSMMNFKNQQYETIILHKDVQIAQLLQKISELNNILSRKNQEFGKRILQINALQTNIESLKNQIYIYEKKDHNDKLTKKFYDLQKEKQVIKSVTKEDPQELIYPLDQYNKQFGFKGLQSLHKRIQMVRMNRMQFDSRNKIKSDVTYSQSTKSRPKGAFDFKGKTFQTSNLNKTRLY